MIEILYASGFILSLIAWTMVAYAATSGKPKAVDAYAVLLLSLLWFLVIPWLLWRLFGPAK